MKVFVRFFVVFMVAIVVVDAVARYFFSLYDLLHSFAYTEPAQFRIQKKPWNNKTRWFAVKIVVVFFLNFLLFPHPCRLSAVRVNWKFIIFIIAELKFSCVFRKTALISTAETIKVNNFLCSSNYACVSLGNKNYRMHSIKFKFHVACE